MRHKGFTLLEVLVVIAIIAILIAMAVPVLQKSKDKGKTLVCSNNLRQLNMGITVYSQENSHFPEGFCGDNANCHPALSTSESMKLGISSNDDFGGYWWFCFLKDITGDYTDRQGVFRCPSRNGLESPISNNFLCGNYGINYSICKIILGSADPEFSGMPLRPDQLRTPSSKLLLTDSGYTLVSWKATAPDDTIYAYESADRQGSYFLPGLELNENRPIEQSQRNDSVNGRHGPEKVNVAFADGHVDRKKSPSITAKFDSDGNVSNNLCWSP